MKKYPPFGLYKGKASSGHNEAKEALDAMPGLILTTSVAGILPKLVKP